MESWLTFSTVLVLTILASSSEAKEKGKNLACLNAGELAALIAGCIIGTLLISSGVAFTIWYLRKWLRAHRNKGRVQDVGLLEQAKDASAVGTMRTVLSTGSCQGGLNCTKTSAGEKTVSARHRTSRSKEGSEPEDQHDGKKLSIDSTAEFVNVSLRSQDFTGLGFTIYGNMRDGIFVKDVMARGPAKDCGKIKPGDRVCEVLVSFRNMVFEDALTILSYASPYDVEILLQNPKVGNFDSNSLRMSRRSLQGSAAYEYRQPQFHPLVRSQSLGDIGGTNSSLNSPTDDSELSISEDRRRSKSCAVVSESSRMGAKRDSEISIQSMPANFVVKDMKRREHSLEPIAEPLIEAASPEPIRSKKITKLSELGSSTEEEKHAGSSSIRTQDKIIPQAANEIVEKVFIESSIGTGVVVTKAPEEEKTTSVLKLTGIAEARAKGKVTPPEVAPKPPLPQTMPPDDNDDSNTVNNKSETITIAKVHRNNYSNDILPTGKPEKPILVKSSAKGNVTKSSSLSTSLSSPLTSSDESDSNEELCLNETRQKLWARQQLLITDLSALPSQPKPKSQTKSMPSPVTPSSKPHESPRNRIPVPSPKVQKEKETPKIGKKPSVSDDVVYQVSPAQFRRVQVGGSTTSTAATTTTSTTTAATGNKETLSIKTEASLSPRARIQTTTTKYVVKQGSATSSPDLPSLHQKSHQNGDSSAVKPVQRKNAPSKPTSSEGYVNGTSLPTCEVIEQNGSAHSGSDESPQISTADTKLFAAQTKGTARSPAGVVRAKQIVVVDEVPRKGTRTTTNTTSTTMTKDATKSPPTKVALRGNDPAGEGSTSVMRITSECVVTKDPMTSSPPKGRSKSTTALKRGENIDAAQLQKLAYFQQQLAKQHEELASLGIQMPTMTPPSAAGLKHSGSEAESKFKSSLDKK